MASIQPYTIHVPEDKLQKLHTKLELADFPDELDDAGWDYGVPLADIKRLTAYWRDGFDWRAHEKSINALPNFHTFIDVDGHGTVDLHFLHQRSNVPDAIPLLFMHGWPGNFLEVSKLLPLLGSKGTDHPAFHVVAPSLPNYGFSSATRTKGFGLRQYAETCHKLMLRLGYTEYVTQGGDWGCMISRIMGLLYPAHVRASHINMLRGQAPSLFANPWQFIQHALTPYTARDHAGFARTEWFNHEGSGYRAEQSTKPQTLGYSLADSPVGLLAWIYEKLHDWTDAYPWTDDEVLLWVSLFVLSTAGPAASLRIYYEATHGPVEWQRVRTQSWIPHVKLGAARFPAELAVIPSTWARTLGPVVYESEYDSGGHFAAWETPEHIVRDLRLMFGRKGPAYDVVGGKDGYAAH